jgi:hypothetical protein
MNAFEKASAYLVVAVFVVGFLACWLRMGYLLITMLNLRAKLPEEKKLEVASLLFTPMRDIDDLSFSEQDREFIRIGNKLGRIWFFVFGLIVSCGAVLFLVHELHGYFDR